MVSAESYIERLWLEDLQYRDLYFWSMLYHEDDFQCTIFAEGLFHIRISYSPFNGCFIVIYYLSLLNTSLCRRSFVSMDRFRLIMVKKQKSLRIRHALKHLEISIFFVRCYCTLGCMHPTQLDLLFRFFYSCSL